MMRSRLSAVILMLCAFSATSASASLPMRYTPTVLTQASGLRVLVENDQDAALIGAQIFVAAGLQQQPTGQRGIAALVAETIARTNNVRDDIAGEGGLLTYTVEGRSVHYYLEARPRDFPAFMQRFSQSLVKPDFSASGVAAARKALIARIGESEGNPLAVGIAMFKSSYYLNGAGGPVMGSAASLGRLGPDEASAFHAKTYKRGAMEVSMAGSVTPEVSASVQAFGEMLVPGEGVASVIKVRMPTSANGTRVIAQRDVGAPFLVVGFSAPSPGNKDFGAMMLLESLLAQSFDRSSTTTQTLAQRAVSAFYLYDSEPASFVVFVNGARVEPTLALREVLLVAHSLAEKPIQPESLQHFKAAAVGALMADTLTLADRSYLAAALQQQGMGPDALNSVLDALRKTTAADVRRVAGEYLQKYIVAVVLPREQ